MSALPNARDHAARLLGLDRETMDRRLLYGERVEQCESVQLGAVRFEPGVPWKVWTTAAGLLRWLTESASSSGTETAP